MQPKKLEQYKYFTPIAWTLCISFAGFVGLIAIQAGDAIKRLESSDISFDQRIEIPEEATETNPS